MGSQLDHALAVSPEVGVVIVTWNNEETIQECLNSILVQRAVRLQVVVVDNASQDSTRERVMTLDSEVQLVANSENVGFARAANVGASKIHAPFLLFVNPDTVLHDDASIATCIDAVKREPNIGTIGLRTLLGNGTVQPTAFPPPTFGREIIESFGLYALLPRGFRERLLLAAHWDHASDRYVGWLLGAFLFMKKDIWDRLGGLTEDFHMYSEDLDWGTRVRAAGMRNLFLASPSIEHRSGHSGEIRWGAARSIVGFRSYYRWLDTRQGRPRRVASSCINLAGFALRYLLYSVRATGDHNGDVERWRKEYRRLAQFHLKMIRHGARVLHE